MARITVEDCVDKVPNRFELVLIATNRARKLSNGVVKPFLEWENDKATVLALREIAAGYEFTDEEIIEEESTEGEGSVTIEQRSILGSEPPFSGSII